MTTNCIQTKPKYIITYECEECNFKCSKKSNYINHLSTNKHLIIVEGLTIDKKNT